MTKGCKKIKVFETTQFGMGKHIENLNFKKIQRGENTETEITSALFPGFNQIRSVCSNEGPSLGNVWYIQNKGKLKLWKTHFDTSD